MTTSNLQSNIKNKIQALSGLKQIQIGHGYQNNKIRHDMYQLIAEIEKNNTNSDFKESYR